MMPADQQANSMFSVKGLLENCHRKLDTWAAWFALSCADRKCVLKFCKCILKFCKELQVKLQTCRAKKRKKKKFKIYSVLTNSNNSLHKQNELKQAQSCNTWAAAFW